MKSSFITRTLCIIIILPALACKKEWLDAKPEKSLVVPVTIKDFQAILDNTSTYTTFSAPFNDMQVGLGEAGAGDFRTPTDAAWESANSLGERNAYIWASDLFGGTIGIDDWNVDYKKILGANVVLEGIEKVTPADNSEQIAWNQVKGSALFLRAYNHFDIAQAFCKPYIAATASTDLGIPLRLNSNINEQSVRATVQQTYDQVISDLHAAGVLLPVELPNSSIYKTRPTKVAVNAMLARVYLFMQNYDSAFFYSNKCLQAYSGLMDFNVLVTNNPAIGINSHTSTSATNTIPRFNIEVIFHTKLFNHTIYNNSRGEVDAALFSSYASNDVRRTAFFRQPTSNSILYFRGSYDNSLIKFAGLATDEMYLIRAECHARKDRASDAMADLNFLLRRRYNATFVPFTATSALDALTKVLIERRKELVFRGLRWPDLRRLNQDPTFAVTLSRTLKGQTYLLPPNDVRYVLPFPPDVIRLSGMQQNPR